jgi:hypothetical protein
MGADKWITFYEPFFDDLEPARRFVDNLERINDPEVRLHKAKVMMHQTQRLVSLADDIVKLRTDRQSLQLLFLVICAENIAKLFDDFDEEGKSRAYVRKFFSMHVSSEDRSVLERSFCTHDLEPLSVRELADCLYSVRCDVVHEGQYWGFHFSDGDTPMLNLSPEVTVHLTYQQIRAIVVRGCINAIQNYS